MIDGSIVRAARSIDQADPSTTPNVYISFFTSKHTIKQCDCMSLTCGALHSWMCCTCMALRRFQDTRGRERGRERGGGERGEGRLYVTDLWGATLLDVLYLHGSQEVPGYTREREGEGERGEGRGGRGECMSLTCGALHSWMCCTCMALRRFRDTRGRERGRERGERGEGGGESVCH